MKKFVFILIFCLYGCAHKQLQSLPSHDTIIKLIVDESAGVIAESKEYSYQFTSHDAIKELKSYRGFLSETKDDIESVSIRFYQESLSDEIIARYSSFISETKILNNKNLLAKYKSKLILKDGYYQVHFKTKGKVYKQANTISDQYLLPKPIKVSIRTKHELDSNDDITGDVAGLIILPIVVPLMMIGCFIGPC
ncbi:hypothetical protein [Gilliamella sp. ESL0250]|uniref:hypothetical protein n=1 Tax=Gilliamella sp. ESL0250 TaxID=2705036 RepID=UPI0015810383|nr:hypothetical protein [Gilliamella sp. ESL0250]NUF50117.1 hypothetical protein [Gilliamella sp. ESL0250]